jgi:hypothetical protein
VCIGPNASPQSSAPRCPSPPLLPDLPSPALPAQGERRDQGPMLNVRVGRLTPNGPVGAREASRVHRPDASAQSSAQPGGQGPLEAVRGYVDCRPLAGPSPPLLPDLRSPALPAKGSEGGQGTMLNQFVGRATPSKGVPGVPSPERITCSEYRPEIYKACLFIGLMCTDLPRLLPQRSLHH